MRVVLLVLALLQASGLAEVMRREICEAACRSDGCDDGCTPGSDTPACTCHSPGVTARVPTMIAAVTVVPATRTAPPLTGDDGLPSAPDPREIAHVPRRAG
ncbi:MAG TPA: hypothetical protein VFP84_37570 [Kofleriaceae bacterium]|nr:hypothetical protein [Kofleriaceae bacterium]